MSDVSETLCIRAPAKINLSLGVLARREDGFHEIESLMVPVTLADTLRVRRTHGSEVTLSVTFSGALSCESGRTPRRNVPSDQTNLVVRAAELLARKAGVRMGLEIELEKKIPSEAGLGGGSSDAAATLWAANRLWGISWSNQRLAELSAELGSDIPWFFLDGPGIVRGRGEQFEAVDGIPSLPVVIVCPPVGLRTAEIYRRCSPDPASRGNSEKLAQLFSQGKFREARTGMWNDLEFPAKQACGDVGRLLEALSRAGASRPLLTGSGSACFAISRTLLESRRIAARMVATGWTGVFQVRLAPEAKNRFLYETRRTIA